MWNWIDLLIERRVGIQPELNEVFIQFNTEIKKIFSINLFAMWYDFERSSNPVLHIAVQSHAEFIKFHRIFNDEINYINYKCDESNFRKKLVPIFNETLKKYCFESIAYEKLRIFVYNYELVYCSFIHDEICNRLIKHKIPHLLQFNGCSIKFACIIRTTEELKYSLCIVFQHNEQLKKAIESGMLPILKQHAYILLKELDYNNYYTFEDFLFAAIDENQASDIGYRDNTVQFKDYSKVYLI